MANGKLGSANIAATTYTAVYTVPADKISVVSINLVNRTTSTVKARIAISTEATTPLDSDFIEYEADIIGSGVLERTGVVCSSNEKIYVYSSAVGITARVHGYEE